MLEEATQRALSSAFLESPVGKGGFRSNACNYEALSQIRLGFGFCSAKIQATLTFSALL